MGSHFDNIYLSQPVGVGEGQVGKGAFPLHKVPGGAHIVVPGDDALHRVPHHVHVDGHRQPEPAAGVKAYVEYIC